MRMMICQPPWDLFSRLLSGFCIAFMLMLFPMSARAQFLDLGCEGVKVDVNVDKLSLEQYQAFVKERRCKCLKIQSECASVPPVPPGPAPDTERRAPANTRTFTIHDGRDIKGLDYRIEKNTSQDACIELCKKDNRCVAFSWDRWNDYCFLKKAVPSMMRIDPASMSAVVSTERQPSVSDAPIVMERFFNAEFRDKAYEPIKDSSFGDCERRCLNDKRCEVFTYETAAKLCRLIRRPYEYYRLGPKAEKRTSSDCIPERVTACSGVKRQAASN
jgi:hypothetical protein